MKRLLLPAILAAILLSVPTPVWALPPVYADVSSYSISTPLAGTTYFLGAEKNLETDTFQFNETANYVERALSLKGLVRLANPDEAQLLIFIGYGIGAPKQQIATYSLPTFGQTGIGSSHTFGTISGGSVSATTTYLPSFGITGSSSRAYSFDTYDRWLRISALDAPLLRSSGKVRDLWKIEVKSTGISGDLRRILPILAFTASPYIGSDTGKAIRTKTKEKSKEYSQFLQRSVSNINSEVP